MSPLSMDEPAFPQPIAVGPAGDVYHSEIPGMSLRDWFAGQYVSGLAVTPGYTGRSALSIAAEAYAIADAMLAQRSKP